MKNQTPEKSISRRKFVKAASVVASTFTILPRHVLGGTGYIAPSDKVNVAVVGVGGRGKKNAIELMQLDNVQITAIADPAERWDLSGFYYKGEAGRLPVKKLIEDHYSAKTPNYKVKDYVDFREMLEKESSVDAILCGTPDHTHAYVSLMSMYAGKHVYCEKPLTHNIWEARLVQKVARDTGLATQMGNQQHSSDGIRQTVELLKAGVIGDVKEVHSWVPATRWTEGIRGVPTEASMMPKGLNWDLWLGPRPSVDFKDVFAPVSWRDFWDYGCGAMGDFGCHDLDAAVWGLDLPAPESVEMFPAGFGDENIIPYGEIGYFRFPRKGQKEALKLTWYSGGIRPEHPDLLPEGESLSRRGALYIGENGIIVYGNGKARIFPESLHDSVDTIKEVLPPTLGHHADWIAAIQGGPAASSNFEYGAHLSEITLLGVLSLRMGGKKINWDAKNMKAIGMPEADKFIKEAIREGWEME